MARRKTTTYRWAIVAVLALVLTALPAAVSAAGGMDEGGGGCNNGSTPNLTVVASTHTVSIDLVLKVTTSSTATGPIAGGLTYRDGTTRLYSREFIRVWLHNEAGSMPGAVPGVAVYTVRGLGQLNTGAFVNFRIDLQDLGSTLGADRLRIRWHAPMHEVGTTADEGCGGCGEEEGGCGGSGGSGGSGGDGNPNVVWLYDSGWMSVDRVQIIQR